MKKLCLLSHWCYTVIGIIYISVIGVNGTREDRMGVCVVEKGERTGEGSLTDLKTLKDERIREGWGSPRQSYEKMKDLGLFEA